MTDTQLLLLALATERDALDRAMQTLQRMSEQAQQTRKRVHWTQTPLLAEAS